MPRPARSLALPLAVALMAPLGVSLGAGAHPAAAASLTSWSVEPYKLFGDPYYSSTTAVAKGRIWQVSFDSPSRPVLRWRRLSDGRGGAMAVKFPLPRDAALAVDDEAVSAQLEISGNRAFVAGNWCPEDEDEGGGSCATSRGFDVQFDLRNGRILRSARPREAPLLVGGTRISYIARPAAKPMVLRDAISRRPVFRFPRDARDVQGAGRYVTWRDPSAYERRHEESGPYSAGLDWTALHVRERTTGRAVYSLPMAALREAIQHRRTSVQIAELQSDGSLFLSVDVEPDLGGRRRPFYPVVVDGQGHIHRVAEQKMRGPIQFSSEVRGSRVLLDVETNGKGTCGPAFGWLTDIGGHRGNTLRRLPRSRNYTIVQAPRFLTGRTMAWNEGLTPPDENETYRVRIAHDLRTLPLTPRDRPRC